jgi:hypothetical protein
MTINFNTEPYYDDFNEDSKFYRILYRPGYAVQARELTQMQTILQNQVSRFGDHVFKEGAMVIPGQASIDNDIDYVKLEASYGGVLTDTIIENFKGLIVQNSAGLQAEVIYFTKSNGADPAALYVKYKNSGNNKITRVFANGGEIQDTAGTYAVAAIATAATGKGSLATVTRGVYYLKGHFVLVEDQTIILDKFSNTPSYRVGLVTAEEIITAEEDGTLFDNAQNSFNFAAPGAHRYYISATLTKLTVESTSDTDFIELIRTEAGKIKKEVRRTAYAVLEETFARRTYDESGNYTVKNFDIDVREYRNNNRGAWTAGRVYLIGDVVTNASKTYVAKNSGTASSSTAPVHTAGAVFDGPGNTGVQWEYNEFPFYNRGIYSPGNTDTLAEQQTQESNLAVGLEPGKAYVQGYEIEKVATEYVSVKKSRDFVQVENAVIPATVGNYVLVTNVNSMPPVDSFGVVNLYDRVTTVPGLAPIASVTATVATSGTGGQFTCGASTLALGDLITITGTLGGTGSITGYASGTTYRVSAITGISPSVTGFTLVNGTTGAAIVTVAGTLTGLTYTAAGATLLGTARVRLMEWHNGTIGTQAAQYKLSLFDIKLRPGVDFSRRVKSFHSAVSGDQHLSFSADINPIRTAFTGASVSGTTTTTAVTGVGTSFQTQFVVGDYISVVNTSGNTERRRITAITGQTALTVDSPFAATVTGSAFSRVSTNILEPENTSLIFPLPYYAIKDVRSALLTNDTIYTVYERFSGTATTGGSPTLTVSTASGTMASAAETDNYIVVRNDAAAGGAIVLPTNIVVSGSSVTFTLDASLSGLPMLVIGAVNKSGSILTEKTKTLVSGATTTLTTAATATKTEVLLGKADGYRLVSVKMRPGTFAAPTGSYTIDITDRYEFDSGQRATHYDVARVVLKNSFAPPVAPIQITYDHFTHSTGDYFTVNSYPANVDYKAIPYYQGTALRDSIDFRARINDAGTGFSGTGSSPSLVPKRGIDVLADFTYHLARKTKIAIDFGGNFFSIDGVSSLNPGEPLDPALGLVLYDLSLEPYTFGTGSNSVQIGNIDNKRYTMRDIGKLEKRIDNLEYYTSLSLLEQQTESLDIVDSAGDTRFKNGFIVDGFTGHNTGNTNSPDYICSIDMEKGELRPFYSMQNVNMIEKNSNTTQRNASNYKLYGDVVTLPVLEDIALITQPYASRLENINPFAVFTFLGNVTINPSSDDWFEIDRRPDLVVNVEGNFNTIKNLAEKAGVLGTVWNAWQTQWAGVPQVQNNVFTGRFAQAWGEGLDAGQQVSIDEINARFGNVQGAGWARREVTMETSAQNVGQSRTGVRTTLVTKIDRQVVGDRVLSTAVIPYIRSRNILVQVRGLKPGTRFYPYFDDNSVSAYCTPASRIVYTPSGANTAARIVTHDGFDDSTNVGGLATATARRINGDSQICLNRGDIITGATSGATAVVVGKEYNPDTSAFALYVMNIRGTFTANETLTGSVSSKTGTFGSVTSGSVGGNLETNFNGSIQLLFNIPNNDALRFRTGTREFKLIDNAVATGDFTSRGRGNYRAEGVLETRQQTVHAVRNAELVEEQLRDNRVITQTAERVVADTGWYDPLAQTFLIEQRGGAFLSKVDIFFATKDPLIPVTLEIREVVNGYPGKRVLPFSKVTLQPEQVKLSSTTVNLDGVATNSYDTATTFRFPSPVYVQENTEYCIVLASDSNKYKVWISQMGELMPGTSRTISEQPYLGVLFKSQNASTWTADQTQDLKFTLYRAKFDTSVVANIEYVNDALPSQRLDIDPFETRSGSTKVRVWHRDHGMPSGSKVIISGVAAVVNNVPIAQLNTTHDISDVDLDSYVITVATAANASGYGGGSVVRATRNMQYDTAQPMVQLQRFSETPIQFGMKTTTGKSVDSTTQIAHVTDLAFSGVLANESNYFNAPCMIASEINETTFLGGNKSVTMNVTMSSTNDALSPILDTHRTSLVVINNKVNNPLETNMNVAGLDDNVLISTSNAITIVGSSITTPITTAVSPATLSGVAISGVAGQFTCAATTLLVGSRIQITGTLGGTGTITGYVTGTTYQVSSITGSGASVTGFTLTTVAGAAIVTTAGTPTGLTYTATIAPAQEAFLTATVGKYLTITGATSGSSTRLITAIEEDGSVITLSSAPSAVVGNVTLTQRERFVDEVAPLESSTYSKYVTKKVNLANADDLPPTFLRVYFAGNIPSEASIEVYYKTAVIGSNSSFENVPYILMTPDSPIVNASNSSEKFYDITYSKKDMEAFDAVQLKLVLKSTNSSEVPRIKDLRIIACA